MSRPFDATKEPRWLAAFRRTVRWLLHRAFRLRVHGLEHLPTTGPVLLAGNHSSFLDGPIVVVVLPRPSVFLVKSELYVGVMRHVLRLVRQLPIRRAKPDRSGLRAALDVLDQGGVLGVFPEGTRGTGTLESVQDGIGYLALKAGCPIVPVVILGTGTALPTGKRMPKLNSRVDVVFGPAFEIELNGDPRRRQSMREATQQIHRRLLEHLRSSAEQTGHRLPAVDQTST
jgi:1-acyl-sn-glycerol-3-phosphate acyltransferase